MKSSVVSLLALVVAAGALVLGLVRESSAPILASEDSAAKTGELGSLDRRLVAVEAEIERLTDEIASLRSTPSLEREVVPAAARDDRALDERLAKLEKQLAKDRAALKELVPADDGEAITGRKLGRRASKDLDESVRVARDAGAMEKDRLEALRRLRGAKLADGTDARLQVLPEMIHLAETSRDEHARADVWRQLSRVGDRSLVAPLINALQNDPSADVREEAAETLGDYLDEPGVRAALQFAAENDASYDVRAQANESLGGKRR